ncbi:MAG: Fic family protein [Bacteroidetes bacterium]|nr:Fic family protein [Bacteroidota bacterium]
MTNKLSVRFFEDRDVRAVWDEESAKWWFNVVDIVSAINEQDDYTKANNYWRWLKSKFAKEGNQLVSATHSFKFVAADGKKRLADTLDSEGVIALAREFPNTNAMKFLDWFVYSDNSIDGQSKKKAYAFFKSNLVADHEIGTTKSLQQIHAYIFGGLYDFAGKIRHRNIAKNGFQFAAAGFLHQNLWQIEQMPETTLDEIVDKYIEMNIAHPFMEGNGRSTRMWLDLILKKQLKRCVDWSQIDKNDYMKAMQLSPYKSAMLKRLISNALTDDIHSREMFMKGIDYSYYYEEE